MAKEHKAMIAQTTFKPHPRRARANDNARRPRTGSNTISYKDRLEMDNERAAALRWRTAVLRLSETMAHASRQKPELAPILREALDCAVERLLTCGCDHQLTMLESWLAEGVVADGLS